MQNLNAIKEAYRVIKKGGKIVVVESCIPRWFPFFEKKLYKQMCYIIKKTITNPPAFQYTLVELADKLEEIFGSSPGITVIPKGRWIMQLGFKFPAFLTPTQPVLLSITK